MPRYLLEVDCAGAAFAGTQTQAPGLRTVQAVLTEAVAALDGQPRHVRPASRLDAGVDAERLPCDVELGRDWNPGVLCQALTDRLPKDLSVRRAARVADDFNAISDAVGKTYRYLVIVRPVRPVRETRCLWLRRMDHPELLERCAERLVGRHDLSGFANLRHDGTDGNDPVRTISAATWHHERRDDELRLTFRVSGAGFLYRQVRGFVGAMTAVATDSRSFDEFVASCAGGRTAKRVGNVAPPEGLTLEAVSYQPEPAWTIAAS
jgi:tRNA pseudouridine38-40 synthase